MLHSAACRRGVFELLIHAFLRRRRRQRRRRGQYAERRGRVTTLARHLRLLHRLQYNRDKIVYTCAIVANIRAAGRRVKPSRA